MELIRWKAKCAVVTGSYLASGGEGSPVTTIELWCRTKSGHSLLLLVDGKRPFIEVSLPTLEVPIDIDSRLRDLASNSDVTQVEELGDKWTDLGPRPHWKVEVKQPWVVPRLRDELSGRWVLSSADIPFINRFFLDGDFGTHIEVDLDVLHVGRKGPKELLAKMPCPKSESVEENEAEERVIRANGAGLYPVDIIARCEMADVVATEPFAAPFVTLSFDLETSIKSDKILCGAAVIERQGERITHSWTGEEKVLKGLTKLVREEDADIITGYNIDNFDLPRLDTRQLELGGGKKKIGVAGSLFGWGRVPVDESQAGRILPERSGNSRSWRIAGRVVMDAWWHARQSLSLKRETLRYVTEHIWPERTDLHKLDIDASKMDEEWATRPELVLDYCKRDALLPIEILDYLKSVSRKEAIAAVAKVPLDVAVSGTTSQLIDSLLIRLADRNGVSVPRTGSGRKEKPIEGGYVHEVEAGIHPWVVVLDFKSMYPSLMISNNICHTTRIDPAQPNQPTDDDVCHISPNGTKFRKQVERKGLVPQLLERLMKQRDYHKQELRKAKEVDDTIALEYHDRMQYGVKILMNSFYGVFASAFYRFTHPDLGSSITAWARHKIRGVIGRLEGEGHQVVYSDTDSIFVSAPVDSKVSTSPPIKGATSSETDEWSDAIETLHKFGEKLAGRFSDDALLEYEKGLSAFFSHGAKKRYIGRVVWPEESMEVKGYETQRTDSFELLSIGMMQLFNRVLDGKAKEGVDEVIGLCKRVKQGDVDVSTLVISRSCKGELSKSGEVNFSKHYQNPDGLPWVRAAQKRIELGLPFTPGMKVGWVVTDASKRPMKVEPWLEGEVDTPLPRPDNRFYAERLATALGRVTEAFGWNADEILHGSRQATLFSFG